MKRLDDLEAKRERDAEFTGEKYTSRFKGKFTVPGSKDSINKNELRWSVFKHKPADEMLLHVQTKVFPFLKELNGSTSPFTKHMANAVFIMPPNANKGRCCRPACQRFQFNYKIMCLTKRMTSQTQKQ